MKSPNLEDDLNHYEQRIKQLRRWMEEDSRFQNLTLVDLVLSRQKHVPNVLERLRKFPLQFSHLQTALGIEKETLRWNLERLEKYGHIVRDLGARGMYYLTDRGERLLEKASIWADKDFSLTPRLTRRREELDAVQRRLPLIYKRVFHYLDFFEHPLKPFLIAFFFELVSLARQARCRKEITDAWELASKRLHQRLNQFDRSLSEPLLQVIQDLSITCKTWEK